MRRLHILIVITLLHDIFAPHPFILSMKCDGRVSVVTLDVCHASVPGSTDDEAPGVIERPGTAMPVFVVDYHRPFNPLFVQLLLAVRNERPPNA